MDAGAARQAARREFGGIDAMKEAYRDRRGLPRVEILVGPARVVEAPAPRTGELFAEAPQRLRCHSRTGVRESDSKARCPAIRPIDRIPHTDRYRPWMVARFRSVIQNVRENLLQLARGTPKLAAPSKISPGLKKTCAKLGREKTKGRIDHLIYLDQTRPGRSGKF